MAENKTNPKKRWGIALIVIPLVIWLIIALVNSFDFSGPWLGSASTDISLGVIGLITVVIGILLVGTSKKTE